MIIENKIDAGDQKQQPERYWNLLKNDFAFAGKRRALLYLSPSGRRPQNKVPDDVQYFGLSYRVHISEWLRSCSANVAPRVRDILAQYAETVARLTAERISEEAEDDERAEQ